MIFHSHLKSQLDEVASIIGEYAISKEDVCIVGSLILTYYGVRVNKDIDIIIKEDIRNQLFDSKKAIKLSENVELVSMNWFSKRIRDDEIISNDKYHDTIHGFKIAKIELVYAKKKYSGRPKDKTDLVLLNKAFKKINVDNELVEQLNMTLNHKTLLRRMSIKKIFYYLFSNIIPKLNKLKYSKNADTDLLIMQDTSKILAKQMKNGKFNRHDIVVRYLAIEQYYGKNNIGFDLYNKMQKMRIGKNGDTTQKVVLLAKSIELFGFCNQSPIIVDKNQKLIDGSHRFASALYFNIDAIPLKRFRFRKNIEYGIKWFEENKFDEPEIKLILNKTDEIFLDKGIFFPVILWPPVQKYFDEIEYKLSINYRVIKSLDYNFQDSFEFFIKDVYEIDDISAWKINKKIKGMENYQQDVRIIYIEIFNPQYRQKENNNHDISKEVENIKRIYRKEYSCRVENYFHDIIIHIGDNYFHNRSINTILKKYDSCISQNIK